MSALNPVHANSIDRTGPVWDAVVRSRNFALYARSEILNPEMELIFHLANPD